MQELTTQPLTDAGSIMAIISRAAADPNTDVVKLEKLLDMFERINATRAEGEFNKSMSDCQSEMHSVAADAMNPQTRSKYASYAALDRALRPIYTKHGFAPSFDTGETDKPETVRVLCHLSHRGGHSRTYHIDMPADGKGAKGGDVMTKTHATGSAVTYGQRYLLKAMFNVAVGEDNDGNGAAERIDESQLADLKALIDEVKANTTAFLKLFKIAKLEELGKPAFPYAVRMLEAKRKKA